MENEKKTERKLRLEVEKIGGLCLKWISPNFSGVPDRIVLMPNGRVYFVELKSEGKRLSPRQRIVVKLLEKMGFEVWRIDSSEIVTKFINRIKA